MPSDPSRKEDEERIPRRLTFLHTAPPAAAISFLVFFLPGFLSTLLYKRGEGSFSSFEDSETVKSDRLMRLITV